MRIIDGYDQRPPSDRWRKIVIQHQEATVYSCRQAQQDSRWEQVEAERFECYVPTSYKRHRARDRWLRVTEWNFEVRFSKNRWGEG